MLSEVRGAKSGEDNCESHHHHHHERGAKLGEEDDCESNHYHYHERGEKLGGDYYDDGDNDEKTKGLL